jgi:lysophospholipase L1-like esterase
LSQLTGKGRGSMNIVEAGANDTLRNFVRGLNKEQAEAIMRHLPKLIALLEEPVLPYLQEPFLQTG